MNPKSYKNIICCPHGKDVFRCESCRLDRMMARHRLNESITVGAFVVFLIFFIIGLIVISLTHR